MSQSQTVTQPTEKITEEDTADLIEIDLEMFRDGKDSSLDGGKAKKGHSNLCTVTLNWVQDNWDWYVYYS